MGILDELGEKSKWREFFAHKIEKSHLSKRDETFLTDFIASEAYKPITDHIADGDFNFSVPVKRLLNRHGTGKKRVVYTFTECENTVLKLLAFALYRYDGVLPRNCYSFRYNCGAKTAITDLLKTPSIAAKYSCKLDIRNYFNSIDVGLLLPILERILHGDMPLYRFFAKLLTLDQSSSDGAVICEKRGAMAGTPISQFFANIYLVEMDRRFLDDGVTYARYSDDIIFFADSREELEESLGIACDFLEKYRLDVNPDKVKITVPGERWEYLGIAYDKGVIRLSEVTLAKIKGKIRRKARSIYRWKLRKGVDDSKAMTVFARVMNNKFFGKSETDDLTWAQRFFPLLPADGDLKDIDAHAQDYMRYVATGRFSKSNYRIRYDDLKGCGYKSLVHEYYEDKAE